MAIALKTAAEIAKIRLACQAAAKVLLMIAPYVRVGITTEELDRICHDFMVNTLKVIPAPLNYRGFPKSICTSINHVICHGIPGPKKLKDGDIINIDVTVIKDGYYGDTSMMFMVGTPSILAKRLVQVAQECLYLGIKAVKPGAFLNDIGKAIQKRATIDNFSVVRDYCGHGIGLAFHEQPQVLHYNTGHPGPQLHPGMIFTIEPMINAGTYKTKVLPDHWTVVTQDHKLSAQWEHTILVTDIGYEILTKRPDEKDI
jgi:methionyl aminopeptidase